MFCSPILRKSVITMAKIVIETKATFNIQLDGGGFFTRRFCLILLYPWLKFRKKPKRHSTFSLEEEDILFDDFV